MSAAPFSIEWHPELDAWVVIDNATRREVERFTHISDAAWYVQSEERRAS